MGKGKGKGKVEGEGSTRERSISWDDDQTKFMLDWYIEYKKEQHAGFIWKTQHHLKCADVLNREFAMGVTSTQQTCCDIDNKSGSSDHEGLNDVSTYAHPIDIVEEDSDTLPSPTGPDNCSPGTSGVSKKRPKGVKSPSKRQPKPKSRFTDATEKIGNTMDRLVNQLASPPPPPMPQLDPYATMWKRIDALPIGSKDKVAVGNYLGRQENEGVRGFLAASCDTTLETWVYQFICDRDGV
ncbi:Os06g0537800 [Oryza sativa Japonica Group]|uniref:Os06g0537800 protein n=1 Tax=Oryza sativa subsp. japonica TaxID=39947 RepID=A0A0P0WXD5_ORYSJ|nr:Os06g0537800 [Oryza sativa Japonica Group]